MACFTAISSVENTIKNHIQYNFHSSYKHNLYNYKQDKVYDILYQYHLILLKYIHHYELIQE